MFVVFDLDGTLADNSHRMHHIHMLATSDHEWPKQDWEAYNAVCHLDVPIMPLMRVYRALRHRDRVEVWTGRDNATREQTLEWFSEHGMYINSRDLMMRPTGDYTKDHDLKLGWMKVRGKPDLIFEDRARVVQMWREQGIICAQVAPGDF